MIVVPNAEHATLQKLLPIKMAVINFEGCSKRRSTSSVCFGFSFSNWPFRRIRFIAVKAVSVDENSPDNNKNIKKARILYILMSKNDSYYQIIHARPINKNAKN